MARGLLCFMSTFTDQQLESQRQALYKFALLKTGNRDDAEDLVQETLIRAWCARDRFDVDKGPLYNWLATMLGRTWADMCESGARVPPPREGPEPSYNPFPVVTEIISGRPDEVLWLQEHGFNPAPRKRLRRVRHDKTQKGS